MNGLTKRVVGIFGRVRDIFNSHQYRAIRQQDEPSDILSPRAARFGTRFPLSKDRIKYLAILLTLTLIGFVLVTRSLLLRSAQKEASATEPRTRYPWQKFPLEKGYYEGLRRLPLVDSGHSESEVSDSDVKWAGQLSSSGQSGQAYPKPVEYDPYPSSSGPETLPAEKCFLDDGNEVAPPVIWAYHGVPEHAPEPMLGSHDVLNLSKDVCFDRYGRYAGYGFGYEIDQGGTGLGMHGDMEGTAISLNKESRIDWRKVDLGRAQTICREKNQHRFSKQPPPYSDDVFHHGENWPNVSHPAAINAKTARDQSQHISRTAFVLRLWDEYKWTQYSHLYIRSLISELNLNAGAEYDIHLLVQIKDGSSIWASDKVYNEVLEKRVPPEYRSMATLWSEDLMKLIFPGPFEPQFNRPGPIHSVGRSMHMALQWFAMSHPEYEFFWNWEMDIRYTGHWYELFDRVSSWAEHQPRKGLWERSGRFYIPSAHGDWASFGEDTESRALNGSEQLIYGPQTFPGWEEDARTSAFGPHYPDDFQVPSPPPSADDDPSLSSALCTASPTDYITFLPIFQPASTFWIFRADVSGYSTALPIPPRRASIVTASRFSHRLLALMHKETSLARHSMCGEMFPASMALHHGLKAVFAPHPVYFNRKWNSSSYVEEVFNSNPTTGESGGYKESVFSELPQHNFRGSTYYYDSVFAGGFGGGGLGIERKGRVGRMRNLKTEGVGECV